MTNYFHSKNCIIPFASVSSVYNIDTSKITVYITGSSSYTFHNNQAANFVSQYLAWLDSQSPKPRSL